MASQELLGLMAALAGVSAAAFAAVNRVVPRPYMDEIFHIPQCQQYCRGNFSHWDPKITTFPGLYLLAVPYTRALDLLSPFLQSVLGPEGVHPGAWCSVTVLRSLNAFPLYLASVAIFYTAAAAVDDPLHRIQEDDKGSGKPQTAFLSRTPAFWKAAVFSLFPLHWFFSFLFYTDVASTTAVLAMYLACLKGRYYTSAICAGVAVLMRQTNAVWAAFTLAVAATKILDLDQLLANDLNHTSAPHPTTKKGRQASGRKADTQDGVAEGRRLHPSYETQQPVGSVTLILDAVMGTLRRAWERKGALVLQLLPLALVVAAFGAFVVVNKGVVVGDRDAHKFSPHLVQPLYFAAFVAALWGPFHFAPDHLQSLMGGYTQRRARSWRSTGALVLALITCVGVLFVVVDRFSISHPYLLADNRHYTFYIWRRILNRTPWARFCMIPLYIYSWASILSILGPSTTPFWCILFVGATVTVLTPTPLIEFRYFTVPAALAWLHMATPTKNFPAKIALQLALFALINASTLHLFLQRPFTWPNSTEAQRFIW